ncbi:MAG: 4-hydroxy-tetrahydrodipicolinate synthase [Candidatus Xenobium sp.]|jgi:4-hydroxy-tetrahydrodipicolinate synthase|nr:4-hydroxy-tetrahydrodipicolinate synthase [Burkholderiales bacterium]
MKKSGFGRLITAMVTPMRPDGSVDFERAGELARRLVSQGTDSVVVCGTTGESPTLAQEEKLRLFQTVRQAVPETPVVAGTGSNCTRSTIEFSRRARDCGVDALLVVAPYYNKPPQEALYAHFKAVAEAVDLPIILYNIPGRTGIEISPAVLARLAEIPNVVGVKQSLPTLDPVSTLSASLQELSSEGLPPWTRPGRAMEIYSGDDSATLPMMAVGGVGVVSVASHVAGPALQQMMQAFVEGRVEEARALHLRLLPLFTGLFTTTNPILVKAALKLQGFPVGGLRLPLLEATPQQEEQLRQVMERVGVL